MVFNVNFEGHKGVYITVFLAIILALTYFSSFICQVAMGSEDQIIVNDMTEFNEEGQQTVNPSGENVSVFYTLHDGHFIFYYDQPSECYWVDDITGDTYGSFSSEYMRDWIKEHHTIYTTGNVTLYYFSEVSGVQVGGDENRPALIHIFGYKSDVKYGYQKSSWDILELLRVFWDVVTFAIVPFPFNIFPVIFSMIIIFIIGYMIWANISGFIPSWI